MSPRKRSRKWKIPSFLAVLIFISVPNWLGTAWPLFTSKTIPEWVSEQRWPMISEPIAPWLTLGLLIVVTVLFVWAYYQSSKQSRKAPEEKEQRRSERENASRELARLFTDLNREIQSLTVAYDEGMDDPCIREWCKSGREIVNAARTQIAVFGPTESALFSNQNNLPETLPDAFAEGVDGRRVQLGMELEYLREMSSRLESFMRRHAEAQTAKG